MSEKPRRVWDTLLQEAAYIATALRRRPGPFRPMRHYSLAYTLRNTDVKKDFNLAGRILQFTGCVAATGLPHGGNIKQRLGQFAEGYRNIL